MIDPRFRMFAPPVDMVLSARDDAVTYWLTVICLIVVLVALGFAWRQWRRTGSPVAMLMILGGAVAILAEPLVDILGACWHPIIGQRTLFESMGRPIPVWLLSTYTAYFGVLPMIAYSVFSRGTSARVMWMWFLIPLAADIILEESLLGISDGLYAYYGNQPLRLHGFPLWWAPLNTAGIFLNAVVMTLLGPRLRGWKLAFVPFSNLLCYGAAAGVVGLPSFMVINSEFPAWVTQLGGLLSFGLAGMLVYLSTRVIAVDTQLVR